MVALNESIESEITVDALSSCSADYVSPKPALPLGLRSLSFGPRASGGLAGPYIIFKQVRSNKEASKERVKDIIYILLFSYFQILFHG